MECKECRGTGDVTVILGDDEQQDRCPVCDGTGEYPTCPDCKGVGGFKYYTCMTCWGLGCVGMTADERDEEVQRLGEAQDEARFHSYHSF